MEMAEDTLASHLGAGSTILTERFLSPDTPANPIRRKSLPPGKAPPVFRLTLDGADREVPLIAHQTLLEAALAAGIDAPNSCTEGHCGACMAQLRQGDIEMASTQALSKRNLARGYVLACQCRATSEVPIWIDFDL
jgi:ferredoxin